MFPPDLKLADVTPVHKNKSKNSKDIYRPVSILSSISKIYERSLYDQIQVFFESILSKYDALFTYLSKAFDCLSHELLIAKLDAYGFDENALILVNSYLSNRKQRVKINNKYSSWSEILFGVPQGSILAPLLFKIFICDMFYFLEAYDIANYADDSTP